MRPSANIRASQSSNFVQAYLTLNNNLVYDTSITTRDTYYKSFFPVIYKTLSNHMAINMIVVETHWFKFILYIILLYTFMDDITRYLHSNYPKITLAQVSLWIIVNQVKNTSKKDGTLNRIFVGVIPLLGNHSLRSLWMTQTNICHNQCRLDLDRAYNTPTLYSQCSRLGRLASKCGDIFIYGYCYANQLICHHKCAANKCAGGTKCSYLPFQYISCDCNIHASIHPACPVRVKTRESARRLDT